MGEIAVGYELYDEAFEIYKKFDLKAQAIKVLLEHTEDLNRALEYASKVCARDAPLPKRHAMHLQCDVIASESTARSHGPERLRGQHLDQRPHLFMLTPSGKPIFPFTRADSVGKLACNGNNTASLCGSTAE